MGNLQADGLWQEPQSLEQRQTLHILNKHFTFKLADISQKRWWTLITPAFSHSEFHHLAGNLVAFSGISGMLLTSGIRPLRYGLLILGSAISAHLTFLYHASQRRQPVWWWAFLMPRIELQALGLSGVVMGLIAALSLAAPTARVDVTRRQSLPAWLLMALYVFYDSSRLDDLTSEVGHAAHLGGAAFGAVFYFVALRGNRALPFSWLLQE